MQQGYPAAQCELIPTYIGNSSNFWLAHNEQQPIEINMNLGKCMVLRVFGVLLDYGNKPLAMAEVKLQKILVCKEREESVVLASTISNQQGFYQLESLYEVNTMYKLLVMYRLDNGLEQIIQYVIQGEMGSIDGNTQNTMPIDYDEEPDCCTYRVKCQ